MNVLFVGGSLQRTAGGAERYCHTLLKGLRLRGHTIYVFTVPEPETEGEPDFISLNKVIPRTPLIDRFLLGYRVAGYLKRNRIKIDLFISGHIFLYQSCEQIARACGLTYCLIVYGVDCWGGRFRERVDKMKHLKKVVSISSFTSQQLRSEGYTGEIAYFPPLLDSAIHNDLPPPAPTSRITLLTVGRLDAAEQYKGHDSVIRALEIVRHQVPEIAYWIVGRGNDMPRLQALARERKVDDCVTFWGFVEESKLADLYRQSDIFIMPSRVSLDPAKLEGEGFGIVFTEAALYGKTLIGPDRGGSMDIIDHEVNGLTCDPEDVQAIATSIIRLAQDDPLRLKLGKNAKAKVLEKFTLNQFDQYFRSIL